MPACQGGTSQRSKCEEVTLKPPSAWRGAPVLSCREGRGLIVSRRPRSSGKLSSATNANGRLWPCTWCGGRDTSAGRFVRQCQAKAGSPSGWGKAATPVMGPSVRGAMATLKARLICSHGKGRCKRIRRLGPNCTLGRFASVAACNGARTG